MVSLTHSPRRLCDGSLCWFLQVWGAGCIGQRQVSKWTVSILHFKYIADLPVSLARLLVDPDLEDDKEADSKFWESLWWCSLWCVPTSCQTILTSAWGRRGLGFLSRCPCQIEPTCTHCTKLITYIVDLKYADSDSDSDVDEDKDKKEWWSAPSSASIPR